MILQFCERTFPIVFHALLHFLMIYQRTFHEKKKHVQSVFVASVFGFQHSMNHYTCKINMFKVLSGLCS